MSAEQEACLGVTLDQGPRYLPLVSRENANNYANRCNVAFIIFVHDNNPQALKRSNMATFMQSAQTISHVATRCAWTDIVQPRQAKLAHSLLQLTG
jgi:hypothetical protein